MAGIAVTRTASSLTKGLVLVSMGWGAGGETVTKVDLSTPGTVYVTTSPGSKRYKLLATQQVAVRVSPL